ncbi:MULTISPECIES: hypothetical protein [unclassified Caballeronia]|uniref:hypothetical protein n=1 Tax=unclassified Caballeronia TaxID=2646786 RepID=UPI002028E04B|nr:MULTISPECIES: hypothetical protein [unclassified Caballeronia]
MILGSNVLASEFERFAKANIPSDASPGQHADMQRAFYCGVIVLMRLHEVVCQLNNDQAVEALEELRNEADAFAIGQFVTAAIFMGERS